MGTWGPGAFDSDDAGDWVVEFDETQPAQRLALIVSTLDAVTDVEASDRDIGVCAAAIAAAATVAALVPGGPEVDEAYGPQSLNEPGFVVDTELRERAVRALRAVLAPESEWAQLWDEAGDLDEATAVIDGLIRVLSTQA
ncbi:hypothetical protein GCM10009624_36300 [Gordonia sinesedis]